MFDLGLEGITLPQPEYNSFIGQLNLAKPPYKTKQNAETKALFLDGATCADVKFPSFKIIFQSTLEKQLI